MDSYDIKLRIIHEEQFLAGRQAGKKGFLGPRLIRKEDEYDICMLFAL